MSRWLVPAALTIFWTTLLRAAEPFDFNRQVRPILSEYCFSCHGPDAAHREAELRLDQREGALAIRNGRAAVQPGRPDASELIRRITAADADERMPPASTGKSLAPQQVEVLRRWISEGAAWQEHWAFIPPQRDAKPQVSTAGWVQNPIDEFVLARLEMAGLNPSPPAAKTTWLRRVTLDLTGLPPSPDEIAEFLADDTPLAEERVLDRLFASPRYGERMALGWLDAARYADTNGYFSDLERSMWPWRDWVIDAFNRDLPFDQFTIEQLAGDLLPNPTTSQLIASGFHRNQPVTNETGIIDEEYRVEYIAERVDTTGTVWLGLTLGCARCHDHKFDPISQREYYQFFAFFNQGPETGLVKDKAPPPSLPAPTFDQQRELALLKQRQAAADAEFAAHEAAVQTALSDWETSADRTLPLPPSHDLATYFDLDERLLDGANLRALTPHGAPDFQPGVLGSALSFDGGRHVELPEVPWDSDAPWSVSLWVKFSGPSSVGCVLSCTEPEGDRRGWDVLWRKGYLIVNLVHRWGADAIEVWTVDAATANRWQHVVVSYDGSRKASGVQVFVDGVRQNLRVQQDSLTGSIRSNQPLRLGRRDNGLGFYGQIDELHGYRRMLTDGDAAALHRGSRLRGIVRTPPEKRTSEQREQLLADFVQHSCSADVRAAWQSRQQARRAVKALEATIPVVLIAQDREQPRDTFVLDRGQYDHPRERVEANVPSVLPTLVYGTSSTSPSLHPPLAGGAKRLPNRLDLARWLVDPRHPLTARVFVNRTWEQFFGNGIVRTVNDFGAQGEPPTHPELLDWLAAEMAEGSGLRAKGQNVLDATSLSLSPQPSTRSPSDSQSATLNTQPRQPWSIKRLQRLIVSSATYRQSSSASPEMWQRDPDNRLLARGPRFRLPAELLRDQALAAAGLLVEELGGPSVKPYQPAGLWEAVTYGAEQSYPQDHGANLYRRGLYTYWKRQAPHPALLTFDAPTRETCVVQRPRTNSPLQALVLLNDVAYVEAARSLAERMLERGGADAAACVREGYLRTVSREPTPSEIDRLTALQQRRRAEFLIEPSAADALLNVGELRCNERMLAVDLASWTVVASALLNLDETLNKP